jgi:predicted aldo/keto reductase-like oxidoreductase
MENTKDARKERVGAMAKIKRRRFGRTELAVTELGFGAMNLRRLDTLEEAYRILDYVLDMGVNLIDTARGYCGENGEGVLVESEVLVGNTIRRRADLEEPIIVVTKGHGYNLKDLHQELKTSLEKLGIEGLGELKIGSNDVKLVYLFHGINEERWTEMRASGVLKKAQSLKEQGVINYIGFSSHYKQGKEIKEALDTGIFDVVELPYNIFNPDLGEGGEMNLLKYAYDRDVGIINMKAFGGNSMPAIYNTLREYITVDYPAMLRFCLSNPYISTVDAGARYPEEFLLDVQTAIGEGFAQRERERLAEEAGKVAPHMKSICRECMHCLEKFECPNGVPFPEILSVYSRYLINERLEKDTSRFRQLYRERNFQAEQCTECGQCLPWCEYELNIPEMLKRAQQVLG